MFKFLAKQGQHEQVARILGQFGKPHVSLYNGPRGRGVMVSVELPKGVSKRSVDKLLHSNQVPGAVARKNKFRIFRAGSDGWVSTWDIQEKIGYNVPFILVRNRKMRKATLKYVSYGCSCCGGYDELVEQ